MTSEANTFERWLSQVASDDIAIAFFSAAAISLILPHLPMGKQLLYPFALLGTWAHEAGHGFAAILAGGKFESLELYSNLGGVAYSTKVSKRGRAFVSVGGLLGPSLVGAAVILIGSKPDSAPWVLGGLAAVVGLSTIKYIRNRFGFAAMIVAALALVGLTIYGSEDLQVFITQLIGIQFCVSSFNTFDYMFTKHFYRNGRRVNSDTQDISEAIGGPYWFWAIIVSTSSILILFGAFGVAWIV